MANLKQGIETLVKESKEPLHIRSFKEQIAHNPDYKAIADALAPKDDNLNDAYFYGFKDAYEKSGYNPSEKQLRSELSDRYWGLADAMRESRGWGDREWDYYGASQFEDKYGNEEDFIRKGLEAHNKHFGR